MPLSELLRRKLYDERRSLHLTYLQLGKRVGVDEVVLWRFMQGKTANSKLIDILYARYGGDLT